MGKTPKKQAEWKRRQVIKIPPSCEFAQGVEGQAGATATAARPLEMTEPRVTK